MLFVFANSSGHLNVYCRPFGDGPRNCIGARMGKLQTKIGLAVLLSKFRFELVDRNEMHKELEFIPTLFLLAPKTETMLRAYRL